MDALLARWGDCEDYRAGLEARLPGEIDALFAEELALYFELEALRTRSLVFLLPAERMASQCVLYADLLSASPRAPAAAPLRIA